MPPWPDKQLLVEFGDGALANGRSLISDATLLLESGRNARAMSLAILAIEECSKAFYLWCAAVSKSPDESFDLERALTHHNIKLIVPGLLNSILQGMADKAGSDKLLASFRAVYVDVEKQAKTSNRIKQYGFYVHREGTTIVLPSESITAEHTQSKVELANVLCRFLELIEPMIHAQVAQAPFWT
jgi:AbiV family abortive infection protein